MRTGGVHLAPRVGHQPGPDERARPASCSSTAGSTTTGSTRTPSASTTCAATVEPVHARARRRHLRRRRRRPAPRGADLRRERAGAVHRAAGLLPVPPGDGRLRGGEQPAPAARHDRPARRRNPADERAADRAEQPRVRRRRRPAGIPQLGQPGSMCRSWPTLWNVDPLTIPHWAPPTHAMQIFGYAEDGSIGFLWISATNPAVSMPESAPDPQDPGRRPVLRRRPGPVPHRDRPARRRRAAGGGLGREDRHASPTSAAPSISRSKAVEPPGEARSDLDIFLMYADAMDFRDQRRRAVDRVAHRRRRRSTPGASVSRRAPGGLHRPVLRQAARTHRASPWPVNARGTRTAPTGSTPTPSSPPTPTTARPTATTCSPAARSPSRSTGRWHRPAGPSSKAAPTRRRTRQPSDDYPLLFTTGRTVYQFHTRTKTAPARSLNEAAPDAWVELSPTDAARHRHRRGRLGPGRVAPGRDRGARLGSGG